MKQKCENKSRILKMTRTTDHPYLNFYEMDVQDRKGQNFSYYMASRAKNDEQLKINASQETPDGVVIYSLYGEKKDRVVLVRQYRYTLNDYIYEFPAGLVEPGEAFTAAGIRELKEETGLDLKPMTVDPMFEKPFYTTIGMTDECCSMIYGVAQGETNRDGLEDSEELEVVLADRTEVKRILKEERVAVMCAYMLMHFLHDEETPFAFLQV